MDPTFSDALPGPERDQARQEKEPRGQAVLAWAVILLVVCFLLYRNAVARKEVDPGQSPVTQVTLRMQGRYLVGVKTLLGEKQAGELYQQAKPTFVQGGPQARLRYAVVAAELAGPEEARALLKELRGEIKSEEDRRVLDLLERLYDPQGRPLTEQEQAELRAKLDWFGELALTQTANPDLEERARVLAPAKRTALLLGGMMFAVVSGLVVGATLLLIAVMMFLSGRLTGGLRPAAGHGGIYAETFALYLLLYVALGYALRSLPEGFGGLWLNLVAQGGSLLALAWPVVRGLTWEQVRRDIGWIAGRSPALEPLAGLAGYLASLPLVLVAFLVVLGLMFTQKRLGLGGDPFTPGEGPSHPIVGVALHPNPWLWVQMFLVACVGAPIVEETMFRGVLYRHLREATRGWGRVLGVVLSALLSGFLFAVIHPQGILGVPVLMTLGVAFALIREWRETLIPCMVVHALNNGIATLVLLAIAG
jgi:membrane protease YdiL (CAAX protease family)